MLTQGCWSTASETGTFPWSASGRGGLEGGRQRGPLWPWDEGFYLNVLSGCLGSGLAVDEAEHALVKTTETIKSLCEKSTCKGIKGPRVWLKLVSLSKRKFWFVYFIGFVCSLLFDLNI